MKNKERQLSFQTSIGSCHRNNIQKEKQKTKCHRFKPKLVFNYTDNMKYTLFEWWNTCFIISFVRWAPSWDIVQFVNHLIKPIKSLNTHTHSLFLSHSLLSGPWLRKKVTSFIKKILEKRNGKTRRDSPEANRIEVSKVLITTKYTLSISAGLRSKKYLL